MPRPTFRHPELVQVLPWRELLRELLPSGGAGCVVEDLDLIVRLYPPLVEPEAHPGRMALVEIKQHGATLGWAQRRTFGQLDALLRRGDPDGRHYRGFFVLGWGTDGHHTVNGVRVDQPDLMAFFREELEISPLVADPERCVLPARP